MAATRILKQGIPFWLLMMLLLAGCAGMPPPTPPSGELPPTVEDETSAPSPPPAPAEEQGEIKRVIEVEADGLTCHYSRQSFWAEEELSAHLANQAKFKADFKQDFEQREVKYNVSVSDYSFSFDTATPSTVARCDIHDAITLSGEDEYRARFEWLLKPLGLDFIYGDFKESEKGLSWESSIQGIPISITLSFPASIGHCHAHVWWSTGG